MSTIESIRRAAPKPRTRFAGAITAVGALVAIAVATLFIVALAGKHTAGSARASAHGEQPYVPLIQYRGTGQPSGAQATNITPGTGAPQTIGLVRAEHSYGAVP
jgi:hypothetical protein